MLRLFRLFNSKATQMVLGVVVLLLIVKATVILVNDCTLLPEFTSPFFLGAIVLAVVYRIINAYGWALVLKAMNSRVNGRHATRIWLRAESRRWLPGGVWGYASRVVQAEQLGISPTIASGSMLVELLLTVAAAIVLVTPFAMFYREAFLHVSGSFAEYDGLFWLAVVGLPGLGFLLFVVRRKLQNRFQSLKQRFAILRGLQLEPRKLLPALGFYVLMGCLNGLVTTSLICSTTLNQNPPMMVVIGATSLAWIVGFLAVFAPGGMVVREATFAACVAPWIGYSTAMAIAILARLVQLAAEVGGMAWVYVTRRSDCNESGSAMLMKRWLDCRVGKS